MSHTGFDSADAVSARLASVGYISTVSISTAVYLAHHLRKPILIEGPAGVGKTELARSLAQSMEFPLLRMQCYEGLDESKALYEWKYGKQLLYTQILKEKIHHLIDDADGLTASFEKLAGFQDLFFSREFLEPRPLLKAMEQTGGSVLLIDEIDKSDEEFEALLLEVLSDYQVTVPEIGTIEAIVPPLVILTSNNTRELGDALKRRCLHLHIDFPNADLEARIVRSRVPDISERLLAQLVAFIQLVRDENIRKLPSISETIDWAKTLLLLHADVLDPVMVRNTLNVILKRQTDIAEVGGQVDQILRKVLSDTAVPGLMERTLTNYIRALRLAGAGVSTTEAIDAARTLELIGYADRERLKLSLAPVLAKSQEETALHERLFDLYFASAPIAPPPSPETDQDNDEGEQDTDSAGSEGSEQGDNNPSDGDGEMDLLSLAQSGDGSRMAMAMAKAGGLADVDQIRFATQVPYFVQRMLEELGLAKLNADLMQALDDRTPEGQARAQTLIEARSTLMRAARAHAEARFEVFGRSASDAFMNEVMQERALGALSKADMERIKPLIAKMAKKLAAKHARRKKVRNRGQLNLRKTLRANAGNDGVPFDVIWNTKRKDKPKIIAVCDVSGSVARYVRFLLLVLYALKEKVADLETFAFSNQLVDVSHDLDSLPFDTAMEKIVAEVGNGSTDYGRAFQALGGQYDSLIDKRTTVLILGDGRNNQGDPGMGAFQDIAAKAKRVIWLCPEHPASWGAGDSCLLQYKPFCASLTYCSTIMDLEQALDDVLMAYG